ncbi:internal virion protein [Carp edema virus]|nr:internal virion protein [Carp edema virus]
MEKKNEVTETRNNTLNKSIFNENELRLNDIKMKIEKCSHNNMVLTNTIPRWFESKEELNLWVNLSGAVRNKMAMGFPLVSGIASVNANSKTKWIGFFEKPHVVDLVQSFNDVQLTENIKLQIFFIMLHLINNNIFCFDPKFDLLKVRTPFNMSYFFNGVGWHLKDTQYIVLLNTETKIMIGDVEEDHYINIISRIFSDASDQPVLNPIHSYDSIIHYMLDNMHHCLDSNTQSLLKIKKKVSSEINISPYQSPGSLVTVSINKSVYFGITLTKPNNFNKVRIAYLTSAVPGDSTLEISDFDLNDVYSRGSLIFRPLGYYINGTKT